MRFIQKRPKIFYGWYIVAACLLIILYASGVVFFGFTAVFEPIAEEFGWSYAQISLVASLRGLEIGLLAPIIGILVDRWGPRKLIFGGGILICLGFLLMSRLSSLAMFYGAFGLLSIGMSTCSGTVMITAVVNWFRKSVGTATGIVVSGFGLGGLLVPVVTKLIDALDWRDAMFTIGIGTLVAILPLSLLIRHKPEQYGYLPDGEPISDVPTIDIKNIQAPKADLEISISVKQALKHRAFWNVALSSLCHSFVVGAVVTHVMPYLGDLGFARSIASLIALLLPVASTIGRLSGGWLGDKLGSKPLFTASYVLMAVGMFLFGFITTGQVWLLVPFVITFSLGWGFNVTTRMALLRKYFGRVKFGTILGFTSGVMMVGNVAGAPIAGWVFDTWGNYQSAWLGFGLFALLGVILSLTLPAFSSNVHPPEQLDTVVKT
ncbi:MAG: MFS transporter [Dehalococcoidales bacterium]|nr:MFS transporter [Dehalococcoidales bacterium]